MKTVRVQDRAIHEDVNIRNSVNSYISTQQLKQEDVHKRREFLSAKDVRWSHGHYSHVVATAAQHGRIALYDVSNSGSSRVELARIYNHTGQVNKLDFDPHKGYMLLSGSQDRFCRIWDIRDPRNPQGYNQYSVKAPVRDVRWSPTNAFDFALCTEAGVVQTWDVRSPDKCVTSINAHSKGCYTIAWHPDGRHIASGGTDKLLRIWDMKSDLKGQRHALQLRCPHGIMNLAWRPAAWSAEFAKRGTWQTCHIATSYTDDDPRTHVWDLRRPLLPFRELSNYETRPMDLLWADKDLLWTVGGAGIFAQSDISYATQPEDSLPPGAVEWCPDNSFYAVVENRASMHRPSFNEPSAIFLNVPQERLSGVEDGTASRSLTDDEGTDTSLAEHSRRQSKTTAPRSKSHPNTPPAHDNLPKVLPLDKTVTREHDTFAHSQIGAMSRLPSVYVPSERVEFVANNYIPAMTEKECAADPDKILPHLEKAFVYNAKVCQTAKMPESAANWRMMADFIVPELKNWADNNRKRRLDKEEEDRIRTEAESRRNSNRDTLSPLPKLTSQGKDAKSPARSDKVASNLFRGIVDSHKGSSDSLHQIGSNMTTPRQYPIPNSPAPSRKDASIWFTLDEAIEPIQPLPPSLASAHSTAAVASRTLLDNNSDPSNSPLSSPERSRQSPGKLGGHRRSATESITMKVSNVAAKDAANSKTIAPPTDRAQALFMSRNQEDRRAALRDYKASARQPFSLEATIANPQHAREVRHDSSESFAMFSASGGSSARARSFGHSFDTNDVPESSYRTRQDSNDWFIKDGYYEHVPQSEEEQDESPGKGKESAAGPNSEFAIDDSPSLPFHLDGAAESKPAAPSDAVTKKFKEALARGPRRKGEVKEEGGERPAQVSTSARNSESTPSKTGGTGQGFFARHHHLTNPLLREAEGIDKQSRIVESDVNLKSKYKWSDFKPIDITNYEPWNNCFAISAYPVICEAIQFDWTNGSSASQFSVHLLSHIHLFFFHKSLRKLTTTDGSIDPPQNIADQLMNPAFSARAIEQIFAKYMAYLRRLDLYIPAAALRKIAVEELDLSQLAGPEARSDKVDVGDQLKTDPLKFRSSCSKCRTLLPTDARICKNCLHRVEACPICDLPLTAGPIDTSKPHSFAKSNTSGHSTITVYCHACGHSTHLSCMSTWLMLDGVNGECPTPDCGCDCGPGLLRDQRIARQVEANENAANNKGAMATTVKRDSKVVLPNPAVDKTRDNLRKRSTGGFGAGTSAGTERTVMSDEKNTPSSAGTAGSTSVWSKKGTGAGPGRVGAPSMGRSNSGGAGSTSVGTSLSRRVGFIEPSK